jgi:hypothetical protein
MCRAVVDRSKDQFWFFRLSSTLMLVKVGAHLKNLKPLELKQLTKHSQRQTSRGIAAHLLVFGACQLPTPSWPP